jgi:hypothetical protein
MEETSGRRQGYKPKRTSGDSERLEESPETWLDLWAIAKYDLGLSYEEFADLTPAMFSALCARRNMKSKHDRFAAGMVAAAVYNVHRANADAPVLTAFDFVRECKPEEEERKAIMQTIKQAIGSMPSTTTLERLQEIRSNCIASLTAQGRKDAEDIFNECWPSLKPSRKE